MIEIHHNHRTFPMARLPLDAEVRARSIVEQLGGVWRGTRGECRCPAHDDASPSLSVHHRGRSRAWATTPDERSDKGVLPRFLSIARPWGSIPSLS